MMAAPIAKMSVHSTLIARKPMGVAGRRPAAAAAAAAQRRRCASVAAATTKRAVVVEQQQQEAATNQQQQQPMRLASTTAAAAAAGAAAALALAGPAAAAGGDAFAGLTPANAHAAESVLRPLFALGTVLYIIRIPMTWYPTIDGTKMPWLIAYAPTEPILKLTRKAVPLVGGVDVTPIVWVALLSFLNEILLGPQGILMLAQRQSGLGL